MARVTIYKNSILASICSIFGYFLVMGGILAAFSGEILAGIIIALLGFGMAALAAAISENKRFKTWKKQVESKGYVPAIQANVQTAIQVYNTYPSTKTLEYIRTLNPRAAQMISEQLAAQKK